MEPWSPSPIPSVILALAPAWRHSVLVSPCPHPHPLASGRHVLLTELLGCDHACPGPGKPEQPSAGLCAKASHTSLSREPGFNLFLVIFHELTLSRIHLEFSQLRPAWRRTEGSCRGLEPGRPDRMPCLGSPPGLLDFPGDLEQVGPLSGPRCFHLWGRSLVTSGAHSSSESKMSPAGKPSGQGSGLHALGDREPVASLTHQVLMPPRAQPALFSHTGD